MAGAMRKMGVYLGLVEEDDRHSDDDRAYAASNTHGADPYAADSYAGEPAAPARRTRAERAARVWAGAPEPPNPAGYEPKHPVAVMGHSEQGTYRITTLHPRTYNEARTIGEHFRDGVPVIMNLTEMDDSDAKRLVDFAAGLSFGLRGSIERVTNKVFLLSPQNVSVTAEDKARIVEGGFFNQS
jgi:cell division inhibitor SepF